MNSTLTRALSLAACLAVPALAMAQDAAQQPPARPAGPPAGQMRAGGPQGPAGRMAGPGGGMALTQEQRDKLKAMQEQLRTDTQAIRDRQRAARRKLQDALRAETLDEKALKAAAGEAASAQADMLLLNRRRQAELKTLLSPEQLRRFNMARRMRNQQPGMGRRMNRPGQQMMGPGRGMGQGAGPMRRGPGMGRQGVGPRQPGRMGPMMGPNQPGPMGPNQRLPRRWRRWI